METGTYSAAVADTIAAVSADVTSEDKWVKAGASAKKHFCTETALTEIKAQYLADAIIPGLKKHHRDALARELPRKNSKDYAEFVAAHGAATWDNAKKAKGDALAFAHTYFARIVKYAFPPVKTDAQPETPKTLETKIAELLNDAIGKCEKAEKPDFDVAQCLVHLRAARAIVTKQ